MLRIIQMRKTVITTIFYLIALGYVFIGVFFFDWSTRMVPFSKDSPSIEVVLTVANELYYILLGIVAFIATFMTVRGKRIGAAIFNALFWLGVSIVGVGTAGYLVSAIIDNGQSLAIYFFGLMIQGIFLLPAAFLYFNKRKIA